MYRPSRRTKETKKEKEKRGGMSREENLAMYDDMLYGMGARQSDDGQRILAQQRSIDTAQDIQILYIDYLDHLRENAERGIDIIPDVEGFCSYIGISRRKLRELEGKTDFSYQISRIKTSIASAQKLIGMKGGIPPLVLAMNFNNNFDYLSSVNSLEIRQNSAENGLPGKDEILKSLPVIQEEENEAEE